MKRASLVFATVAVVGFFVTAGSAQAGHLERPDLLQVEDTFSDTNQPPGVTGGAYLEMEGDDIEASIFITAFIAGVRMAHPRATSRGARSAAGARDAPGSESRPSWRRDR